MKLTYPLICASALLLTTACSDFLDATPDSRINVDTKSEVAALLNSAYPNSTYVRMTELASDNADDLNGEANGYYDRFSEQCFRWQPVTESDNESPAMVWQSYYAAIAAANQALVALDKMDADDAETRAYRGEALLCRAYAHFMLANLFCQHYSPEHAETDLGIPYTTKPETTLNPHYERGTVAENYQKIEKDLLEGLSLMSDAIYSVPRFHFNAKAAYTFASRFYLFYQQPEKVVEYATKALGTDASAQMRNYDLFANMPTDDMQPRSQQYTSSSEKANYLLVPVYSYDPYYYSGTSMGSRFNNNSYIAQAEQLFLTPWAPTIEGAQQEQSMYRMYWFFSQVYNKILFPKQPYYFEEANANTHTGYYRTLVVAFKAEEALLNRAEAYTLLGRNQEALADINVWTDNFIADKVTYNTYKYDANWNYIYAEAKIPKRLTLAGLRRWARAYDYYTPQVPRPRKHLNPEWTDIEEVSDKENLLQCLLLIRRLEFIHEGMRWFDIKRYGIKIYRRLIYSALNTIELTDSMSYRDPRQAIQIPFEARAAGIQPNPTNGAPAAEYIRWTANDTTALSFNR